MSKLENIKNEQKTLDLDRAEINASKQALTDQFKAMRAELSLKRDSMNLVIENLYSKQSILNTKKQKVFLSSLESKDSEDIKISFLNDTHYNWGCVDKLYTYDKYFKKHDLKTLKKYRKMCEKLTSLFKDFDDYYDSENHKALVKTIFKQSDNFASELINCNRKLLEKI